MAARVFLPGGLHDGSLLGRGDDGLAVFLHVLLVERGVFRVEHSVEGGRGTASVAQGAALADGLGEKPVGERFVPPAQDFLDAGAELLRVGYILQEGVQVVHQVGVPGADPVAVIGGQAPALARGDFGEDLPGVPLGEHLQGAALARFGLKSRISSRHWG